MKVEKEQEVNVTDERLEQYLETIKNNIGLVDVSENDTSVRDYLKGSGIDFEVVGTIKRDYVDFGDEEVDIIKYHSDDGEVYAVENTIRFSLTSNSLADDFVGEVYKLFKFESEPTKREVVKSEKIREVERVFGETGELSSEYTCLTCGGETHVLDAYERMGGDFPLLGLVELARNGYCGC